MGSLAVVSLHENNLWSEVTDDGIVAEEPMHAKSCNPPELPDDVVESILLRLPEPQLVGAQRLSKTWKSVLASAAFSKRRADFEEHHPSPSFLTMWAGMQELYCQAYNPILQSWRRPFVFPIPMEARECISCASADGGLVCLVTQFVSGGGRLEIAGRLLLWNPLTGCVREIPRSRSAWKNRSSVPAMIMLVLNKKRSGFKIIAVDCADGQIPSPNPLSAADLARGFCTQVFDSISNVWITTGVPAITPPKPMGTSGCLPDYTESIVCGGIAYSIVSINGAHALWSFDSDNFVWKSVPGQLPFPVGNCSGWFAGTRKNFSLFVREKSLVLVGLAKNGSFERWKPTIYSWNMGEFPTEQRWIETVTRDTNQKLSADLSKDGFFECVDIWSNCLTGTHEVDITWTGKGDFVMFSSACGTLGDYGLSYDISQESWALITPPSNSPWQQMILPHDPKQFPALARQITSFGTLALDFNPHKLVSYGPRLV